VRVKNIKKLSYSSRIYDIGVGNDIILVKRENSKEAYWLGKWRQTFGKS